MRIAFSGTRRLVLLLAFWLAAGIPSGRAAGFDPEAGLPLIRNFLPETYRGHSQIFASVEDPAGVMYFGTYGQVVSFDGEHWRQHPTPGTWTRALTVGPDGLVYVGGGNALGRLETGTTGHLAFKSLADLLPAEHREFASVWSAVTAGDTVLFAIDGATLAWAHGAFRVQPFPGRRPAVRAAGGATFCHVGDELRQWDGTGWKPFAQDAVLGTARRLTVLAAPDGWRIALDTGALYQLGRDGRISPWPTAADEFLRRAGIRNGVVLPDGRWVLSTGGEGVLLLSPEGQPLQRLGPGSGLAHPATYGLTSSRQGPLWIETANGLSVLDPAARWSVFDPRNGRPDTIGGEPQRFQDELVVTMSDLAPVRLRPPATPFDQARLEPYLDSGPTRLSNTVVVHGALLSGHERGLLRLSRPPRPVHASSSQIEDVLSLAQLPGLVVVGMLRGIELVRVSPEFDATLVGRVPDFELEITNAREFPDRTVWVGTTSGVALRLRLNPDGTLRDATRFGSDRGLPAGSGWVKIQRAPDGPIVCVRDGVFRLDPTGERLGPDPRFAIHRPSGINTLPIEGDGGGRFWFQIPGGEAGFQLGCLDTRAGASRWTLLPPALNAALGYGGARSITYLPEGERQILWVSGTRATLRLDLSAPESLPPPPAVVISQAAQGSTRWKPTADVQGLPFRRETLQFRFSSPSATLAPVRYETRLVGYAGDWTPVSAPEATFTNLVGGPFTLEVRATDAWGRTGPASRASFRVAPPWHRTPLALGVYALALGGGVAGFVRWRLGRSERERARLEQLVAQRTRELATARDAAESANRAKSSFLAAMSHELRTPLNGVIGYAQILQADARLAPDQKERLGIVLHSGEHLLRMINDVLDLAKIEAGKVELRPAPFALPDFLRDVAAGHAPAAARKGLAFELQADGALPPRVLGDGQKLRQVLDNLIGNAIKFTAHGRVTVQVHPGRPVPGSAAPLVFAVTDTGPGIEPSDQARLFQPFEQAGTHGDTPGTGLGLSICRSLVERMGGTLTLQSTPGQGSVFAVTVDLPSVTVTEDERGPTHPPPVLDGSGRRVWVIDDHAVNRRLVIDVLSPLGFACTESSSASEALERLLTETGPWPDLVVVDVRMTGVDGLEFTRRFRAHARGQHARILLMSASVLSFDPAAGRSAGADDFLAKPFRTADLLGTVGRLLGLASRPMPPAPPPPAASAPPPAAAAARLRETLDSGDLDEFRRLVAGYRRDHPESDTLWRRLDEAAGAFQLSRLRQLLESA